MEIQHKKFWKFYDVLKKVFKKEKERVGQEGSAAWYHIGKRSVPVVVVDISELVHECHDARIEPYDILR